MEKDKLINKLLVNDWLNIQNSNESKQWFFDVLRDGFIGYRNQTLEELKAELNERGLN